MKTLTLTLTHKQHAVLCGLAIEERTALRESAEHMDDEDLADAIERYNELAVIFDLDVWEDIN